MNARAWHDYAPRAHLTIRDRKRLAKIAGPLDPLEHARRQRQAETIVVWTAVAITALTSLVVFALCLWWAPV